MLNFHFISQNNNMSETIGFLGPEGTNSELALDTYINTKHKTDLKQPFASIEALFKALIQKQIKAVLMPIENSTEGSVSTVLDTWLHYDNVYINDAFFFPIHYNLYTPKEQLDKPITCLVSHPQCLAQCQHFLQKHYPDAIHIPSSSSTGALLMLDSLKKEHEGIGIIGNNSLSHSKQLTCLKEKIEDQQDNKTLFGLLETTHKENTTDHFTSLVFSTPADKPGSLQDALAVFSKKQINLSRIISRPTKIQFGNYVFFIDIQSSNNQSALKEALAELKNKSSFFRVLGSYTI